MANYLKKIDGVDYEFLEDRILLEVYDIDEKSTSTPIRILADNKYNDIIYCYGKTNISAISDTDGTLQFQYRVLNKTDEEIAELRTDKDFTQYLGEILNSIILDDLDNEQ